MVRDDEQAVGRPVAGAVGRDLVGGRALAGAAPSVRSGVSASSTASTCSSRGGRWSESPITTTTLPYNSKEAKNRDCRSDRAPLRRPGLPDIHTTAGKLADLELRLDEAVHAASEKAVEKQHAKGRQTARERIEMLFDEGSFVELDELARHRSVAFGLEKNRPYGDGVITGYGTIDGRQVCVFSQDFTIFGGSLGEVYGEKITKVMDLAIKTGCPIVGINEGAGARIQEGVVSLGLYGEIFRRNVHASGVIPQISLIMGNCAGGHVYSPAVTDFTVMVDKTSAMFITGPDVIKTVTGEDVSMEDLGGARTHNTKSGNAHYMGADEEDALEYVKALLGYLPQNNMDEPPSYDEDADLEFTDDDLALDTLIPDSPNQPYDMHDVIDDRARRRRVPRGAAALRAQHHRRLRPGRGPLGRHRGQPADAVRRHPRHRRLGEGRAVRAHLRRVQRARC